MLRGQSLIDELTWRFKRKIVITFEWAVDQGEFQYFQVVLAEYKQLSSTNGKLRNV